MFGAIYLTITTRLVTTPIALPILLIGTTIGAGLHVDRITYNVLQANPVAF